MKRLLLLASFITYYFTATSQTSPFDIYIEPMNITGLGGLQAYAFGQYNGKWLIVGGRLDGLHRRQPFAAFDVAGNNNKLIVVDPVSLQTWSAPLNSLSSAIQQQFSSTNMEFHQEGNYLYIIGGYGFDSLSNSRKTFGNLSAIDVPAVINAVINGTPFSSFVRQISDPLFAVTGGHLKKINNTFLLIAGNKFDGDYNPMGNPTYTQVYTNAIRRFLLDDNGTNIQITHLSPWVDTAQLHRRDYNAVPQIYANGLEGVTIFSGVFQPTVDLPYLNCVEIDSAQSNPNLVFQQHYNHYHCAVLPIYSSITNEMHSIFFGGIAQFYDSSGILVQNNNVPFVKTIAKVTRSSTGVMTEHKLPVEMPYYIGAGAEFIPISSVPHFNNDVLKLDDLVNDSTLVGYIYGGISSTAPTIFFTNNGTQSSASSQIFKVYVLKNSTAGYSQLNYQNKNPFDILVNPNPNLGEFDIRFRLNTLAEVKFSLYSLDGKLVFERMLDHMKVGDNLVQVHLNNLNLTGYYLVNIETPFCKATRMVKFEK